MLTNIYVTYSSRVNCKSSNSLAVFCSSTGPYSFVVLRRRRHLIDFFGVSLCACKVHTYPATC